MQDHIFQRFSTLIYESAGIILGSDKKSLLTGRIRQRMQDLKIDSYSDYLKRVNQCKSGEELIHLINAIATHHTFFFREADQLTTLREHVSGLINRGQRRFRIWSAACSSGEEPYSIAMSLHTLFEELGIRDADLKILATDISTRILGVAQQGLYRSQRTQTIPEFLRDKFFVQRTEGAITRYQVCDQLRNTVSFRRLNLSEPPLPMKGPFDAVFCRNVMIYFDDTIRRKLISEIDRLLNDDGLMFLGLTESALGLTDRLKYFRPSVYCKRGCDVSAADENSEANLEAVSAT